LSSGGSMSPRSSQRGGPRSPRREDDLPLGGSVSPRSSQRGEPRSPRRDEDLFLDGSPRSSQRGESRSPRRDEDLSLGGSVSPRRDLSSGGSMSPRSSQRGEPPRRDEDGAMSPRSSQRGDPRSPRRDEDSLLDAAMSPNNLQRGEGIRDEDSGAASRGDEGSLRGGYLGEVPTISVDQLSEHSIPMTPRTPPPTVQAETGGDECTDGSEDIPIAPNEQVAHESRFRVTINSAHQLPELLDTFCVCCVGGETFKTAVIRKSENPEWNQEFIFGDKSGLPMDAVLHIVLKQSEGWRKKKDVGVVSVPIWEFMGLGETSMRFDLKKNEKKARRFPSLGRFSPTGSVSSGGSGSDFNLAGYLELTFAVERRRKQQDLLEEMACAHEQKEMELRAQIQLLEHSLQQDSPKVQELEHVLERERRESNRDKESLEVELSRARDELERSKLTSLSPRSHGPGNAIEISRLVETITKLNRVIDQLRTSQGQAENDLRVAHKQSRQHLSEIGKLAAENESQARELTVSSEDLSKRTKELREAFGENARLEQEVNFLKHQAVRTEKEHQLYKQERKLLRQKCEKLQLQVDSLQDQLSDSNEKFLGVTGELMELRKYRAGSSAHLHAQNLVLQRLKHQERDNHLTGKELAGSLGRLASDVRSLKTPIHEFGRALDGMLDDWAVFNAKNKSTQKCFKMERARRRNVLESLGTPVQVVCSVVASEQQQESVHQDEEPVHLQPNYVSGELMVAGDTVNRYFGFDKVLLQQDEKVHLLPLVDGLFDGDRAVVVSSGPGASSTTNSILQLVFNSMEQVVVSMSCVDVYKDNIYDMLVNSDGKQNKFEFDRIAAKATGRIHLERAGITVVEARSKYEASMVAAMGSGNRAAASASRNLYDDQDAPESHLLFTLWIESTDPFTGKVSNGKVHIIELFSVSPEKSVEDDTVENLVRIIGALRENDDQAATIASGRSPGTLSRLFCNSTLLAIVRDCLDDNALGVPSLQLQGPKKRLLVNATVCISHCRNADLLTALQFAVRIRSNSFKVSQPKTRPQTKRRAKSRRVVESLMCQTEGMVHALFMAMDTHRVGSLSRQEFRNGIQKIDPTLSRDEIELFMDSMDQNRDGRISFHEFFRVLGDARTDAHSPVPAEKRTVKKLADRERNLIRAKFKPPQKPKTNKKHPYLLGYTAPVNFEASLRR